MFKRKITVDQFAYLAIQTFYEAYESNLGEMLDMVQWENTYKLDERERKRLWREFENFHLIALSTQLFVHFKGNCEMSDISQKVTEAYSYYLMEDQGVSRASAVKRLDKMLAYQEKLFSNIADDDPGDLKNILPKLGVAFAETYCHNDLSARDLQANRVTQNFEKNFAAIKMAKPLIMKKGIIGELMSQYKPTWE
ncbi:hypothetical protein KDA23_05870 [Candidatus Saccharibacteria bacterium]|nr:hypothetical protein [Candidatus Saccharibacteria bacterium]